jgi:hypothetical protein
VPSLQNGRSGGGGGASVAVHSKSRSEIAAEGRTSASACVIGILSGSMIESAATRLIQKLMQTSHPIGRESSHEAGTSFRISLVVKNAEKPRRNESRIEVGIEVEIFSKGKPARS